MKHLNIKAILCGWSVILPVVKSVENIKLIARHGHFRVWPCDLTYLYEIYSIKFYKA